MFFKSRSTKPKLEQDDAERREILDRRAKNNDRRINPFDPNYRGPSRRVTIDRRVCVDRRNQQE